MIFLKTKTIKQSVTFRVSPHDVFEAIIDADLHARFTESEAEIHRGVGGYFSVYGGSISGTTLELVQDKKIVQSWKIDEEDWPENHYSKVVFEIRKVKEGTQLDMTHSEVPEACAKNIAQGWKDYYWEPMKKMLENKKSFE